MTSAADGGGGGGGGGGKICQNLADVICERSLGTSGRTFRASTGYRTHSRAASDKMENMSTFR